MVRIKTRVAAVSGSAAIALRGLDAVLDRHPDVHEHDVRLQLADERQRLGTVGCLPHRLEVGRGVDEHAKAAAHERLVVGDENADAVAHDCRPPLPPMGSRARTTKPPPSPAPAVERAPEGDGALAHSCEPVARAAYLQLPGRDRLRDLDRQLADRRDARVPRPSRAPRGARRWSAPPARCDTRKHPRLPAGRRDPHQDRR